MKKIMVKDLTAEEKINLVWGKDFWHTNDLNGKLPYIRVTDASMGVRMPEDANSGVDKIDILYDIRNVSKTDGKEVSQVYIHQCGSKVYRPYKELKGFSKNLIKAGDTVKVCVSLGKSAFEYWSNASDRWQIDDGIFEILIGSSSADIKLTTTVQIKNGKIVG